ncbi:ChiQ/YbfN family lipoprotein [Leclercia sp. 29361]|uniref:ChiQ/YbfN family lipoprotein n=1 Tax=Leclercia sp. 29361 TaxID=2714951 RepID=UPI001A97DA61|nr:ChiQ/YbfN family lipoprotein [Leclercia sp. 29361]
MLKKIVLVAVLASGLAACAQPQTQKEDMRLKEAYSACINTAEGSPEKLEACQSVLDVLRQEKAHEQFATQETVRVADYQACIQARKTGNNQDVTKNCDKIWQEIRSNNAK